MCVYGSMVIRRLCFFFFFQAEDGIRDYKVTGVQTCALPIYLFVIILIFAAFNVEKRLYHRVLFWGILGAIIFRSIFIFTGAILVIRFNWILYLFAAFLIFTGIRMFINRNKKGKIETENHSVIRFAGRWFGIH